MRIGIEPIMNHKSVLSVICLFACFLLAGCTTEQSENDSKGTFAFVNVNLVPMDSEQIIPNQTVIILKDRIYKIGDERSIKVPDGIAVIDGRDKYLMPGLADMHVHVMEEDQLYLFVANGVTTIRNMWGEPKHLEWRERINNSEMIGPTIYTAGSIIDGDPPVFPESEVIATPKQARGVVSKQKDAGYDFLKVYSHLSFEAYDSLIAAAQEGGIPVAGHVPSKVGLAHVLAAHQRCIEHLDGYETALAESACTYVEESNLRSLILTWTELDMTTVPGIVHRTREAGTWNCPTLIVYEKWVAPNRAKELLRREEFRYLSPAELEYHRPETNYTGTFTPEMFNAVIIGNPIRKELTRALHDGGARILLGTDCGNPLVVPGFSILEELQHFVDAGLSPYEAIKAGTHDAAEFFNALDEFGTVTEGRRADLILLEANPLDDVQNIANRAGVMIRGKWHTEIELQSHLNEIAARYSNENDNESKNE